MTNIQLDFDFRSSPDGAPHADLGPAVLDMCEWADRLEGVTSSSTFLEHHGSPDGYMPSPIVFASAVAGRTRQMAISAVLLLPLYHPIRLAGDLAVLDLLSGGRVNIMFGGGYRREEYDAFGVDLADRGRLMDEGIEVLKRAWTGEVFEYNGKPARVMPRPLRRPRPPILMAGSSKAAALRAARVADAFIPDRGVSKLMRIYRDELVALGKDPGPEPAERGRPSSIVAVSEDPDKAWAQVAPHCLHVMNSYAGWLGDQAGPETFWPVADVDELRKSERFAVLTPHQCVERARAGGGAFGIAPLTGGISPEIGWESLHLIEKAVLPLLKDDATAEAPD